MPAVPGVKPPAPLQVGPEIKADWIRWKEDWSDYAQVQELNAKPYPTQVALFRIALGTEGKRLLRNQPVSQSRNGDGDLVNDNLERTGTLMKMMDSAVNGEINDTYERFVFTHRTQKRGETFDEYLTALKELRKTCNICDCMYDTLLKDQIINGITDSSLQEKLLQKRGLSLDKCIDACRAAESAAKQVKEMSQSEVNRVDLHPGNRAQRRDRPMLQVRSRTQPAGEASAPSQDKKQCRFCGRYHAFQPGACPARTRKCNKCGKTGHFAAKCHARNPRRAVNQVADDSSNEGADFGDYLQSDIGTVNPTGIEVAAVSSSRKAIMRVQGKKKAFLIDTGAGANLISAHDVDTSMLKLHTPGRTFHMWNGSEQRSLGRAPIKLYNPKQKRVFVLNFDIVPDKLTPILGSAAAQAMDLVTIHDENFERVAAVLPEPPSREEYVEKYPDVFKSQLGKLEGTVGLQVDPDITPVSLPARQVPIALRRSMKEELERLQKLEVITPVTKPTNWVSQAVIIQKPDKSIRLCIDPRPLNKALKRERFHLTTFEELLPNLAGAKVFTKVDLKSGYWHVVLDEDASDLTATATPYGRFKWKRLPFGLSVSSEIFGRKIREAFDGLEGVHCIADDAIIAGVGSDMAEAMKSHETRLNAFLQRCQRKGIVLNANKFELRVPSVVFMGHVLGTDEHPEEFNFDTVNSVIVADLTDEELKEMREHTLHDKQLASLLRTVKEGWPNAKKDCPPELTPFWDFRDEISASQQILIKGQMIFVPTSLRKKYIKLTHNAHQGADACIRRARESIFWPSMAADIRAYVERCEICARAAPRQQKQPLQQPDTPNKAWDTVAADIFTTNGKDYLVTVDSLSGYFEVDRLRTLTAAETIQKLRIIFARYGSPRFLFTDNGRQFASTEFRDFTRQWRVDHRTSSPHYPRSNGQAEAAVKVAKSIMKKANEERGDVYKALLDYRNTPRTTTGLSPVQVLMQRKTRTASLPQQIPASASDRQAQQAKQKRQQQVKTHHDKTAAELKPIGCGTNVWFMEWQGSRETWSKGTVTGAHDKGRSYFITTSSGRKFRRNRVHIRPDTTTTDDEDDDHR